MTREDIVEALLRQMLSEVSPPTPNPIWAELGAEMFRQLARDIVASDVPYLLVHQGKAIMCLRCGAVSHNPHDVEQLYCGACHRFHAELCSDDGCPSRRGHE